MTPFQSIEHGTKEIRPEEWGAALTVSIGNYSSLGARPWDEVRLIEVFPGVQVGDRIWVVPESWLPPGTLRRASSRTLHASSLSDMSVLAGISSLDDQSLCRSLLALTLPRRTQTGVRRVGTSTWLGRARWLIHMARWVATNRPSSAGGLWSHLLQDDWKTMLGGLTANTNTRNQLRSIVLDLAELGGRGMLSDFPLSHTADPADRTPGEPSREASRRGKAAPIRAEKKEPKTTEPFSEAFVTEVVGRAIWLQDNLGSQLVQCWALLRADAVRSASVGRTTAHPKSIEERRAIIASFPWRDASGKPLVCLPWAMTWARENISTTKWPPRDAISINVMIGILQALNYCLTEFCTGARSSEVLDGSDSSVDPDGADRYHARTFKYDDSDEGLERDWPIHPRGKKALQLQQEIANVIRPEGKAHLWMLLQDGAEPAGSPLRNVNEPVIQAVSKLGLSHLTGDSRPHSHRWRHTVARLIALCVAAAPQVLMDLFGHRDFEMTLRYMLSDPNIARDVMRVAAEIAHATAEEALTDIDEGTAGGPAAPALQEGIWNFKMRRGKDELDADTMSEAISILTFNGRQWQLVREGVLCTKQIGQAGPCTQGRGDADAGGCRTPCVSRLELARAKAGCEGALTSLLREHATAVQQGEDMVVANIEGQVLAHLYRWEDMRELFLAKSETARAVWSTRHVELSPANVMA